LELGNDRSLSLEPLCEAVSRLPVRREITRHQIWTLYGVNRPDEKNELKTKYRCGTD
jgi:hypothetical protein